MSSPEDLLRQYVDDADSLSERDWSDLLEAVEKTPALLTQLREQFAIDELLSQRFGQHRGDFALQVDQRIADITRGNDDLSRQVDEIHQLALQIGQEQTRRQATKWSLWPFASAAAILVMATLATFSLLNVNRSKLTAAGESIVIDRIDGDVVIRSPSLGDRLATVANPVTPGERIVVRGDASLAFVYQDGTQIRVGPNTELEVRESTDQYGKRLTLMSGELSAVVAGQPSDRPFEIATLNATAIVRGTRFTLRYQMGQTELDVDEGKVELFDAQNQKSELIATGESAVSRGTNAIARRPMPWPSSREHLIFAMVDAHRVTLRNDENALPEAVSFAADGMGADWTPSGEMELDGGWFYQTDAGEVAATWINGTRAYSIEIIAATAEGAIGDDQTLVAIGPSDLPNVALRQFGERLVLELPMESDPQQTLVDPTDAEPHQHRQAKQIELGTVSGTSKPFHLIVRFNNGAVLATIDGVVTCKTDLGPMWREWANGPVTLGASGDGSRTWHGKIVRFAIHGESLPTNNAQTIKNESVPRGPSS
jgi:hypothetical protein